MIKTQDELIEEIHLLRGYFCNRMGRLHKCIDNPSLSCEACKRINLILIVGNIGEQNGKNKNYRI